MRKGRTAPHRASHRNFTTVLASGGVISERKRPVTDRPLSFDSNCSDAAYRADPAVPVIALATLDADERLAQPGRHRAGLAAADLELAARKLDRADRGNHGGRAAGKRFPEPAARHVGLPLLEGIRLLMHGNAL